MKQDFKWFPLKKHNKCLRLIEISTRCDRKVSFTKVCELAFENKRSEYQGSGPYYTVDQVLLSSNTQLGVFVATGKQTEYSNIPMELFVKMVNDIPEELDIGPALSNEVEGFVGNNGNAEVMLSSYFFSLVLSYLINTRFKIITGNNLLDIERRGKYFYPGQLYFLIITSIIDKRNGCILSQVYKYLLINIHDGSCEEVMGKTINFIHEIQKDEVFIKDEQNYQSDHKDQGREI